MKYIFLCMFFSLACAKHKYHHVFKLDEPKLTDISNLKYPFVRTGSVTLDTRNFTNVGDANTIFRLKLYSELFKLMESLNSTVSDPHQIIFQADISDYVDKVFGNTNKMIKASKYDPAVMPNYHEDMSCNLFWLIPYSGTLDMWDGYLEGASTIVRNAPAMITYDKTTKHFDMQININFETLKFTYHYKLYFPWMFSSEGLATGGVTDLHMNIAIGVDCVSGIITLDDYSIIDSGHISISFHTFSWIPNWGFNLLLNTCTALLNGWILSLIQGMVKDVLTVIIDTMNAIIQSMMNK